MIKLGLVLVAYAVVSCTILAVVNNITAPKIAQNQAEKVNVAMSRFFPQEGLSFESVKDFKYDVVGAITIDGLYVAKDDGNVVGAAAEVTGPTYDHGTILVGLNADGTVSGVQFLKLTDSPGFGSKAKDSSYLVSSGVPFYEQFTGMNAGDGFFAGRNFDAISGATITSEGVASLLNEGTKCLLALLESEVSQNE